VKEALGATSPNSTTPHASLARRGSPFTKKSSCLDARWLARKGLFPRDYSTRRYDMHVFNPIIDWLSIGPRAAQVTFVTGQIQLISINWLPIRGVCQSVRADFECPGCGHNACSTIAKAISLAAIVAATPPMQASSAHVRAVHVYRAQGCACSSATCPTAQSPQPSNR
jgi:hypothetical protein